MSRTAVFSVIFPSNLPFFGAFLDSLARQRDNSFDLFLLSDNVPDIEQHVKAYRTVFPIHCQNVRGSIAAIRKAGFSEISRRGYEYIIFADTDDLLGEYRIEKAVRALQKVSLAVSDLTSIDAEGNIVQESFWAKRIEDQFIFSRDFINTFNVVGLGNTAIRGDLVKDIDLPDDLITIDWFWFYRLMESHSAMFLHQGGCYYRQHDRNTVGVSAVNPGKLRTIVQAKLHHYRNLVPFYSEFAAEEARHERLARRMADKDYLQASVDTLTNKAMHYFWWEETNYLHE